ncbi:MAG TPA: acetyl-CoA hydrolase/transferase C-terminal domain-containing protein [bacterium]|nr:acetyl-CoA hydrolase/transferase C-terminal domain-containing protein [bacterium]
MDRLKPEVYDNIEKCVDDTIKDIGNEIRLGMPIAVGKPTLIANEFYKRAKKNPKMSLCFMSGLNLQTPKWKSDLERRFIEPLCSRVFPGYPDPVYIQDALNNKLPDNVELRDFYITPGAFINNQYVQQGHISSNYTHVPRDVRNTGLNVAAVMTRKKEIDGKQMISLSSNADAPVDMIMLLQQMRREGTDNGNTAIIGQVNQNLPFMYGSAAMGMDIFDRLVDNSDYYHTLFGPPREPVGPIEHFVGLNTSPLIKDNGTIQIGIGSLGDALTYGLQMRHNNNNEYKQILKDTGITDNFGQEIENIGGLEVFNEGVYGCSELIIDGFVRLINSGIIKRRVYDNYELQKLVYDGKISSTKVERNTLDKLIEEGAISEVLTDDNFSMLQKFGIIKKDVKFADGTLYFSDNTEIKADLSSGEVFDTLVQKGLGEQLDNGILVHGSFFLGPQGFYDSLNNMTEEERWRIQMREVSYVNQLYGGENLKSVQRKNARFVNVTLMVTLLGGAASDTLESGQVVSGVGGQYNFVSMAHALPDGRSIIILTSTRTKDNNLLSKIVWSYGNITIPRHLRDIVVTEYGIADIRGKSDKEVICSLLNIADSNFQNELLETAKKHGKVPKNYRIPDRFRNNYKERLISALKPFQKEGLFPSFPFGTDFTDEELVLGKALRGLKSKMSIKGFKLPKIPEAQKIITPPSSARPYLERMKLDKPSNAREKVMQKLVLYALASDRSI